MRDVVLYMLTSIDGSVEDPHRYFPPEKVPGPPGFDEVMEAQEVAVIAAQDAVLLGRGMYEQWARYWPTSDAEPFASFINGVQKYVVTSTPLTTGWGDAEAVSGPLPDVVRTLKALPGGDIGVHGSITLARSLLAEDLVDVLHLVVGPVIDPAGPRLFEKVADLRALTLRQATPSPSGAVWLTYARKA